MEKHNEHTHNHDTSNLSGKRIFFVTLFNAIITVTEIIGGLLSGSLALLSDALHNLSDTLAIALSYVANRIARRPNNERKTYGYKRAEILSAFINSSVLLILSGVLIYEAIRRFMTPETIDGKLLLIVATIGLIANLLSVLFLRRDSKENLNIKSSYLHLLSDTISSVGVILGGIAIILWQITWVDPLITLLIALYIMKEAFEVVKETVSILMQSSPNLDFELITKDIESISHVLGVHHIHAWMNDEHNIYFEAHIDMEDLKLSEIDVVNNQIEDLLKDKYEIHHVTLQSEFCRCDNKDMFCKNKEEEND